MAEDTPTPKSKSKPAATVTPALETPKFEIPSFEMPKIEMPAAFREVAEKSITQVKENYDKMKRVAEEATDMLEGTYATASRGCSDYGLKVIESARVNSNAAFDLMSKLLGAKSVAEAVELSTGYVRSHFETVTAQAKELTEHVQKVASETAEPIKEGFSNAFSKAA